MSRKRGFCIIGSVVTVILLAFLLAGAAWALPPRSTDSPEGEILAKPTAVSHAHFDGNTIDCIMTNDGLIVDDRVTGSSGMEWPKGTGKTIDFASGLWLAGIGRDDGKIYTACAEYASELKAGPVGSTSGDEAYRIYKINKDGTGDWDDWPVDQGAPVDEYGDPAIIGDQTLWWACNDSNVAQHSNVFGTSPMGVEVHIKVFGFNRADPMGNIMFIEWKFINKGTQAFDSCFVAQWDDPDLGDASDDLVGCDTTLSLGYCYNGGPVDGIYGATPPALGFDFFQGPEVEGEYLGMSAFAWYYNGAPDPFDDPEIPSEAYWFMNGYAGDGTPYTDNEGNPTIFPFAGDPVAGTGDLDGVVQQPGDRRFLMSSGPFTLAPGDTQIVVGAKIIAPGVSNTNAVAALRFFDSFAQVAYDNDFVLPSAPEPKVEASMLDKEIVLNWQEDFEEVESYDFSGYTFQGYNVYQGASVSGPWTRLATFDIVDDYGIIFDNTFDAESGLVLEKPVQWGNNTGIQRYFVIDEDVVNQEPLSNYRRYYFAVTSYALAEDPAIAPRTVESPKTTLAINDSLEYIFAQEKFDTTPNAEVGDELDVAHAGEPMSDGIVTITVLDPLALTGHQYEVTFFEETVDEETEIFWKLTDTNTGVDVVPRWANQEDDQDYPIVDGMLVKVTGPPPGIKDIIEIANGDGPLVDQPGWPDDLADDVGEPYGGNDVWHSGSASTEEYRWYVSAGGGDGGIDRMARSIAFANAHDFEMRFTEAGGIFLWAYDDDSWAEVPIEMWDVGIATFDDPSDDIRMLTVGYSGDDVPGGWGDWSYADAAYAYPATDWTYARRPDNELGSYDEFVQDVTSGELDYIWWDNSTEVLARITICSLADDPGPEAIPPTGTVIRWYTNKPNSAADEFTFTSPAPTAGAAVETASLDKINVVPNPYFGFNPQERIATDRFVTFTHLPGEGVTIRIFTLDGTLVKIIDDDERELQGTLGTPLAYWYLRNQGSDMSNPQSGVPVASGMYIAHVEVKGVGDKILKMAVFMPEERLDFF
jgi:hypothetical protein